MTESKIRTEYVKALINLKKAFFKFFDLTW